MTYEPCDACPTSELGGLPCWAGSNGFKGICKGVCGLKVAEDAPRFRRMVIERTTGKAMDQPAPPPHEAPPAPPRRPHPFMARAAKGNLLTRLAHACNFRGERVGDGCNCEFVCAAGHGVFRKGYTTHLGCLDCVQGRPPVPPSES